MKAILVINETPKKCHDCQLMTDDMYCKGFTPYIKDGTRITKMCVEDEVMRGTRHDRCPLKPLPRKNQGKFWHNGIGKENTYVCGWNACIDELLGGNE